MGWHWKIETSGFDGLNIHGKCTSCQKEGMFDGNGDFFVTNK
jgi:hypothetical protein